MLGFPYKWEVFMANMVQCGTEVSLVAKIQSFPRKKVEYYGIRIEFALDLHLFYFAHRNAS